MATDATLVETHDTPGHDTLVPDPQVQKEFGVTACRSGAGTETSVGETLLCEGQSATMLRAAARPRKTPRSASPTGADGSGPTC
jgi:hypothetical protein